MILNIFIPFKLTLFYILKYSNVRKFEVSNFLTVFTILYPFFIWSIMILNCLNPINLSLLSIWNLKFLVFIVVVLLIVIKLFIITLILWLSWFSVYFFVCYWYLALFAFLSVFCFDNTVHNRVKQIPVSCFPFSQTALSASAWNSVIDPLYILLTFYVFLLFLLLIFLKIKTTKQVYWQLLQIEEIILKFRNDFLVWLKNVTRCNSLLEAKLQICTSNFYVKFHTNHC